jgi:hypothetical protein
MYIALINEYQHTTFNTVAAEQSSWNRDRTCLGITICCLEQRFPNFFQVGTTFIS